MIEKVIALLLEATGQSDLSADTKISSLDIDSLDFVEFMQSVEREFWQVPDSRWQFCQTPADIVRELEAAKC